MTLKPVYIIMHTDFVVEEVSVYNSIKLLQSRIVSSWVFLFNEMNLFLVPAP